MLVLTVVLIVLVCRNEIKYTRPAASIFASKTTNATRVVNELNKWLDKDFLIKHALEQEY